MLFIKEDMLAVNYHWNPNHRPADDLPSRGIFDPSNGNQVLFLINAYADLLESFTLKQAHALENTIAHQLPMHLKSERSVFNWIRLTMDLRH